MENTLESLLTTSQAAALIKRKLGRACPTDDSLGRYIRRYAAKLGLGVRLGPPPKKGDDRRDRLLRQADIDALAKAISDRPKHHVAKN